MVFNKDRLGVKTFVADTSIPAEVSARAPQASTDYLVPATNLGEKAKRAREAASGRVLDATTGLKTDTLGDVFLKAIGIKH